MFVQIIFRVRIIIELKGWRFNLTAKVGAGLDLVVGERAGGVKQITFFPNSSKLNCDLDSETPFHWPTLRDPLQPIRTESRLRFPRSTARFHTLHENPWITKGEWYICVYFIRPKLVFVLSKLFPRSHDEIVTLLLTAFPGGTAIIVFCCLEAPSSGRRRPRFVLFGSFSLDFYLSTSIALLRRPGLSCFDLAFLLTLISSPVDAYPYQLLASVRWNMY